MLNITIISCVLVQTTIAIYLLRISKIENDFEKCLQKLLYVLLGHLSTKFFLLAILHNVDMYSKVTSGFGLCYGPLLLAATRAYLQKPLSRKAMFLHLTPFMIFSFVYIVLIISLLTRFIPLAYIERYNYYYQLLVTLSLFSYPFAIKITLQKQVKDKQHPAQKLLHSVSDVFIAGVFTGMAFCVTGIYQMNIPSFDLRIIPYICFTSIPLFILRYKLQHKFAEPAANFAPLKNNTEEEPEKRYQKSGLDEEMMLGYENTLTTYMQQHQVYLNTELSLEILSQKTCIPKHHLTQLLNDKLHKSFYRFVNEYRIQHATEKLKNQATEVNILSLAYDCGFNSKSSFNNYFKQLTGYTPSAYRKLHETSLPAKA
ncbi:AraC-type DNA-binding protein [Filimonas lacunae]|uniref:AraC-type DNA-binding protein n=1 Tax=Filimonas lacunae TaxID=477680 RepID=A0A173M9A3_9BACT|nr:helix-turn-helix domain-containing protein [Filimonas lacunae]BAV04124.1 transcriptional regulator, AraC family [Filimonas lacunae]SIT15223.1 AraC-type DNA-binding protein [Filimonas lacunae]